MFDLEELTDCVADATKQLFRDIEDAWSELKTDLRETVTVRYLRPGGVAYCRADGKRHYGILTGTQIISLNGDGEPDYMDLEDFLTLHGADKLKVAGKSRIAIGSHEVDFAARMAVEEERFPSAKTFVLKCLGVTDASGVDEALEKKFGSFEWLTYDLCGEQDGGEACDGERSEAR